MIIPASVKVIIGYVSVTPGSGENSIPIEEYYNTFEFMFLLPNFVSSNQLNSSAKI